MSIQIRVCGSDDIGAPSVYMAASGKYAPDVAHDVKNRAVEAYRELFGDFYTADRPPSDAIPGTDESEPA